MRHNSISGLGGEWPFSDVLTHISISAEIAAVARPFSSCGLSSRSSSCDAGSVPGKLKPKDLLSHLHHILFIKASHSTAQIQGVGKQTSLLDGQS